MLKQTTFTLVTLVGMAVAAPRHAWSQLSDADKKGIQDVTDRWSKAMERTIRRPSLRSIPKMRCCCRQTHQW